MEKQPEKVGILSRVFRAALVIFSVFLYFLIAVHVCIIVYLYSGPKDSNYLKEILNTSLSKQFRVWGL